MGKTLIIVAIVVFSMILGIGVMAKNLNYSDDPVNTASADVSKKADIYEVVFTDDGFEPAIETVQPGDMVSFVNKASKSLWVESINFGQAKALKGFNSGQGIGPGETYEFTFDQTGKWGYRNYLSPNDKGQILVK